LIKIDGKVFATLELAMPFFKAALKVEISNEKEITTAPAMDNAELVWLVNLPLLKK
jgi:hypothetical protein